MPWWSWILIWIALVALSLLFYGVLGVRLYRQATTALRELGEAMDRFSRLPSPADDGAGASGGAAPQPLPGGAVFASPARMRHDYDASKLARQDARRLRRIQRKKDRGQPQALRDIELG
ncbi:hypothetical protein [Arthrobacter sp. H-02-3]|uniref:hypothetical protein n=1 Tax=Arthrobacter sp. H-02-3 TaxID=2703675 RepID=UPI000DD27CE2|nr:hypothetical protein [Arthrobacter sp. H-02-3]PVZ59475.1 hypothetical protein C9424_04185 [Arthrobacter sp. H-02-3]